MKCTKCDIAMRSSVLVAYNVGPILGFRRPFGMPNVRVKKCPQCEQFAVPGEFIDGIAQEVMKTLLRGTFTLCGDEIKFIRTQLGLSREEFGVRLERTASMVDLWEHDRNITRHVSDCIRDLARARTAPKPKAVNLLSSAILVD